MQMLQISKCGIGVLSQTEIPVIVVYNNITEIFISTIVIYIFSVCFRDIESLRGARKPESSMNEKYLH